MSDTRRKGGGVAKLFKLLILVPIAIVVLVFAVANRQVVTLSFDPFSDPEASGAVMTAPLFILMFVVLIVGVVIGGVATWFTQGTNRRRARLAEDEADRWRAEAERMRHAPPILAPAAAREVGRDAGARDLVVPGRVLARGDYA